VALVCIAPPLVEPVSLPELKQFCRLDPGDTSQDSTISMLGREALSDCETFTARRFVQQTWRLLMDFFPGYVDLKLAGQKVSSPFVSGSNAVLVGIRYAIILPYPPVKELVAFNYLNANGLTTSMIVGPLNIAAVQNPSGQPVTITTTTPHTMASGAGVTFAANPDLISLIGQAFAVITVTGDNQFTLLGVNGTGTTIPAAGTVTGFNFMEDLQGNPARLTPIFGQMWPVARVVVNAVQVDYNMGYANPITVSVGSGSRIVSSSDYDFQLTDVGREISIPGAGADGLPLNTVVTGLAGSPPDSVTVRDVSSAAATNQTALIVNTPSANPAHWSKIKRAICVHTLESYLQRMPKKNIEDTVQRILYPVRDLRL